MHSIAVKELWFLLSAVRLRRQTSGMILFVGQRARLVSFFCGFVMWRGTDGRIFVDSSVQSGTLELSTADFWPQD